MLGHPKFKYGDKVSFLIDKWYNGTIYIVDKYGTFEDDSDVSYDILSVKDGSETLFKHINEKYVEKSM